MAKRFISFGSIDQFRTVIKNITHEAQYVGYDEVTKEVQMNRLAILPVITATGSEKIHGTNAAVCYSLMDGFWVQSRKNIIDSANNSDFGGGSDNAGCAFTAYKINVEWMTIIGNLAEQYQINLEENIISVYFEWSGGNIQKKSALTGLDKRAMIFQYFKVSPIEPQLDNTGVEVSAKWLETKYQVYRKPDCAFDWVQNKEANIFNIMEFPKVQVIIDFNEPLMSHNEMIALVDTMEKNSPVGQEFGIQNNVGEGYVFTFEYNGNIHRFKVKGEEHSKGSGKVKTLKVVDEAAEKLKVTFVNDFGCTEGRLDQMFTEIVHSVHNGDNTLMSMRDMKQFLSLVVNDIIKEESDRMTEMGLEPKPLNSMMSKVSRMYFQDRLDAEVGI